MANSRMDFSSFVGKLLAEEDADVLREGVKVLAQALMELEVSAQVGAGLYERTDERSAHPQRVPGADLGYQGGNGRAAGAQDPARDLFPFALGAPQARRACPAAVVQEAYVKGISTRKVDDLVRALGMDGISKSEVSRICKDLDKEVEAFRSRPIEGEPPYVWLDATYHKVREAGRVVSMATVVTVGVSTEGWRQVLGIDVGPSKDQAFWTGLPSIAGPPGPEGRGAGDLRRPRRPGPLDRQGPLRRFLAAVPGPLSCGTSWPRFRSASGTVAAIVRTIFAQPDHQRALAQLHRVADGLAPKFPQAAELLEGAAEAVLAHFHFPEEHRRRLHSTNSLERLHKEVKRRTAVVGIFPDRASLVRWPACSSPSRTTSGR